MPDLPPCTSCVISFASSFCAVRRCGLACKDVSVVHYGKQRELTLWSSETASISFIGRNVKSRNNLSTSASGVRKKYY